MFWNPPLTQLRKKKYKSQIISSIHFEIKEPTSALLQCSLDTSVTQLS